MFLYQLHVEKNISIYWVKENILKFSPVFILCKVPNRKFILKHVVHIIFLWDSARASVTLLSRTGTDPRNQCPCLFPTGESHQARGCHRTPFPSQQSWPQRSRSWQGPESSKEPPTILTAPLLKSGHMMSPCRRRQPPLGTGRASQYTVLSLYALTSTQFQ